MTHIEVFSQLVLSNYVAVLTAFLKRCYCTDMLYCGNALAAAAATLSPRKQAEILFVVGKRF